MFPGCLVGLKGQNGGGKLFAVKEVFMVRLLYRFPLPSPSSAHTVTLADASPRRNLHLPLRTPLPSIRFRRKRARREPHVSPRRVWTVHGRFRPRVRAFAGVGGDGEGGETGCGDSRASSRRSFFPPFPAPTARLTSSAVSNGATHRPVPSSTPPTPSSNAAKSTTSLPRSSAKRSLQNSPPSSKPLLAPPLSSFQTGVISFRTMRRSHRRR